MGIPKFFRLISERWPLIAQEITVAQEIEYDNLYLDMNSILHNCSHSNDNGINSMTDEQIFGAIFAYIDYLFNLIKPKKVFYMAIDGVAPRAKMNQQRARRFRSAVEAEEELKKAIESGEPIPKDPAFDKNAITPGTEFMAKVTENLKFYINQKVSNDKKWQDIEIILSGHEVPGEGEHKIMEYIRVHKAQDDYNPDTRHCVYGLDADLIILGLVAHEPHFSLLREEVTFGRNKKTSTDLTNQTFFLLHISLVRDYLEEEFKSLSDEISFEYDFERVVDDLILILYVIGNDFLPNLPDLHLNKGAFPLLLHSFKEAMRRTDGYLNEKGKINLKRLAVWLDILSIFELENFEEGNIDVEWFNKQLDNVSRRGEKKRERQGKELLLKKQKKMVGTISAWILKVYYENFDLNEFHRDDSKIPEIELPSDFFESDLNVEFMKKFAYDLGLFIVHSKSTDKYTARLDIDGIDVNETADDLNQRIIDIKQTLRKYQSSVIIEDEQTLHTKEDLYNEKFTAWKDKYYKEKLGFSIKDEEELIKITENYLEGLQWVLNYYYTGICSWPWYYKYHYAPRISDLAQGLNVKFDFEMGKPFTPFEQLMSVLPERSKELIPVCYRHLMTDDDSPIKDFYPNDCEVDRNGKTASWEAVVLLSFVDENRLKEAMAPLNSRLTIEEKKRNSFGNDLIYNFNPQIKTLIKSPLPSAFPDFESHATESSYSLPSMEGKDFIIGLAKGVKTGIHMIAGFPTLKTIPHSSHLSAVELLVFQQPTRSESMILTLENEFENINPEQFAHLYCGKIIYAGWPYLKEYSVVYVTDSLMRYEMSKNSKVIASPLENFELAEFDKNIKDINYYMHKKRGLRFAANDITEEIIVSDERQLKGKSDNTPNEPIEGLVYAKRVIGVTPNSTGKLVKVFSDKIDVFPIQLIVPKIENVDSRFEEKEPVPISEEYPNGTPIVFLGKAAYGTSAVVVGTEKNKLAIQYTKPVNPEPLFGIDAAKIERESIIYHPISETSRILGLNTYILSKITSTYMIYDLQNNKINVGLSLKFEGKGIKTLGYTRKNGRSWEYSDLAINLIKEYMSKFSELLTALMRTKCSNMPQARDLFKKMSDDEIEGLLRDVKDFIANKRETLSQVSLNSDSLSRFSINKIENQIIEYTQASQPVETINMRNIPRFAVLNPAIPVLKLKQQQFRLGDRVLYVLDSGKVPLFSKGTVIGFKSSETAVSVHVLFDFPILTGNRFDARLKTQRGLSLDSSSLLNISLKQFVYMPKSASGYIPNVTNKNINSNKVKLQQRNKSEEKAKQENAKKEEEAKLAKLKEQSKNELLNIINNDNKEVGNAKKSSNTSHSHLSNAPSIESVVRDKSEEAKTETKLPSATNASADAKNLLNMLVSSALAPPKSESNPQGPIQQVPQQFNMFPMGQNQNAFPPPPFPMPFPMPMMPHPMYPYMPQMPMMPMNMGQMNGPPVQVDTESSKKVLEALQSVGIDTTQTVKPVELSKQEATSKSAFRPTGPSNSANKKRGKGNNGARGTRGTRGGRGGRGDHRGSNFPSRGGNSGGKNNNTGSNVAEA